MINPAVYPVTKGNACLIRYSSLLGYPQISHAFALHGIIPEDVDSSYVDEGFPSNIRVKNLQQGAIYDDPVIMLPYEKGFFDNCDQCIFRTIERDFRKLKTEIDYATLMEYDQIKIKKQPQAPVIAVTCIDENSGKFETQLALFYHLQNHGKKVLYISSRDYGNIVDGYDFPEFMFHKEYPEKLKIELFHNYVLNLEAITDPDIILLGIPGNTKSAAINVEKHYGVFLYYIISTLRIDATVLCLHYQPYNKEFFEWLWELMYYRYGLCVNEFVISNIGMNYQSYLPDLDVVDYDYFSYSELLNIEYKYQYCTVSYANRSTQDAENLAKRVLQRL